MTEPPALSFRSEDEAERWALENFQDRESSLFTPKEQEALHYYKTSGFKPLNRYLRGQGGGGTYQESLILRIDSAIAKQKVPQDVYVYRGISGKKRVLPGAGESFSDGGFVSTSLDADAARRRVGMQGTVLRIKVPAGTNAAYLDVPDSVFREYELLLPRGRVFRVGKDVAVADGKGVDLELV